MLFGCWTLIALVFASQWYVYSAASGDATRWTRVFGWTLAEWYIWALFSPFILWLTRCYRFNAQGWRLALLVHLTAGVAFSLLHLELQAIVQQLTGWANIGQDSVWSSFIYFLTKKVHLNLLTYAGIVGISHAAFYYRRYHEREAQAHKLEAQLARSQLQTLQMQLHPHFLFNTLHTISELIHSDPKAADRMVARLGDLLRLALEREAAQEVPLKQELEFLQKYLEIEQTRFHDRLVVEMDVDPQSLDARLPNMILQPLVENAIKHGLAARPGAGKIEIHARRDDGMLRVRVCDNGTGLPANWQAIGVREGIGLRNTRQRLAQLYGQRASFELRNRAESGLEVMLAIPYHEMSDAKGEDK